MGAQYVMMRAPLVLFNLQFTPMRQISGLALPVFGCTKAVYHPSQQTDIKQIANFAFQVFIVFPDIFYTCISYVDTLTPIRCLTTLRVYAGDQTHPNCACLHLFTVPTCICTRLKSISQGVFCVVPACWSRDKAADHILDSIGHRCVWTDHRENVTACPQDVDAYF